MKKIINILLQILLIIWQLPQCVIGLIMLPFLGKKRLITYRNYCWCYEGEYMKGGISLGCFAFVSPNNATREEVVMHEVDGHTKDSKIFGPLYLLIIGLPSILNAWLQFTECYYDFFTEKRANKHAGLKVKHHRGWCVLCKKQ